MTDASNAFSNLVPGFDFLQGLVKNAGAAMPGMGQWIAPTLDPEELDKRISELKTVQFWLEQNARMLAASIQALEVQRMTLSTLKSMNVSMSDLTESLKIRMPEAAAAPAAAAPAPSMFSAAPPPAAAAAPPAPPPAAEAPATPPTAPPGVIDPMQWWGALTQQFSQLAARAMNDSTGDAARTMAGTMVKQGMDAATDTFRKAAAMPASVAQGLAAKVGAATAKTARTKAKAAGKKAAPPRSRPAAKPR
jgi:hypothetical protein